MITDELTNTISINRGSKGTISFQCDEGFEPEEKIEFRVYKERELDQLPVLSKSLKIKEKTNIIDIELTEKDTLIGEPINDEKIYWYELISSKKDLILGFDNDGAKQFILLPKGVKPNE